MIRFPYSEMTKTTFLRLVAPILFTALPGAADSLSGKLVDPQGAAVAQAEVSLSSRTGGRVEQDDHLSDRRLQLPGHCRGPIP